MKDDKYYVTSVVDAEVYEKFKEHLGEQGFKVKGFMSQLRNVNTAITETLMQKIIEDGDCLDILKKQRRR